MATFGKTTVGALSITYNTGNKRGSRFTLNEDGIVAAISVYATGVNGSVKFAIYNNGADNKPSTKVWADDTGQTMVSGWNTKSGLNVPLSAGTYWLCWMISGTGVVFYYDAEPARAWNVQAYADAWPGSWGTTSYGDDRSHSIYCTYTPAAAARIPFLDGFAIIT
jgi:hypothetical protein